MAKRKTALSELTKVRIVLKDKEGKVTRELLYPPVAAARLLRISRAWKLDEESPFEYVNGSLILKKKEVKTDKDTASE